MLYLVVGNDLFFLIFHEFSCYYRLMKLVKFATQVDFKVLKELRSFAKESEKSISKIVTDAISEYLNKARLRPAFKNAMTDVLEENKELLEKLAK